MSAFAKTSPSQVFIIDDDAEVAKRIRLMLPRQTRDKLNVIERARTKESAMRAGLVQKRMDLMAERSELRRLIAHCEADKADYPQGAWTPDNQKNLEDLVERCAELDKEVAHYDSILHPPSPPLLKEATRRGAQSLVKFAPPWRDFLLLQPITARFKHFAPELPKIAKGKDIMAAIADVRSEVDAVVDQVRAIETARLDTETILQGLHRELDRLSRAPDISGLLRYRQVSIDGRHAQGGIKWPTDYVHDGNLTSSMEVQRGSSLLAWLFKDELAGKLEAEIKKRIASRGNGLTVAERNAKMAVLKAELLTLHRMEERLYCAASDAGNDVGERRVIHPLAFLEIVTDDAAEAAERKRLDDIAKKLAIATREPSPGYPVRV